MKGKKKPAVLLAIVMLAQVLFWGSTGTVYANPANTFLKTEDNLFLGTTAINPPSGSVQGRWGFVYLGKFENKAVRYRVLAPSTQAYNSADQTTAGRRTMLLDCDSVLFDREMDGDVKNFKWEDTQLRKELNSGDFLNPNNFSPAETKAIVPSYRSRQASDNDKETLPPKASPLWNDPFAPLDGDRVFLLDLREAVKTAYGYDYSLEDPAWRKTGITTNAPSNWWMRTGTNGNVFSVRFFDGKWLINSGYKATESTGVSPAFNVDLASVIFSSPITQGKPENGYEYKLTLKDENMVTKITGTPSISGADVTIPFALSGSNASNADQISVLVTRKPWNGASGWEDNNEILQYTKLNVNGGSPAASNSGTFALDTEEIQGVCGKDYHIYLVAEDFAETDEYISADKKSDNASEPAEVILPADPDDPDNPVNPDDPDNPVNPDDPKVSKGSMKLNTYDLVLKKGTKRTIKAKLKNDSIAKVSFSGKKGIIAKLTHTKATITVEAGKTTGEGTIKVTSSTGIVKKVKVKVQTDKVITKSLSMSKKKIKVYTNGVAKLVRVKASPDVVSTKEKIKLTNPDKKKVTATYDADTGYISLIGKKPGTVNITVEAGKKEKTLTVNVKDHDLSLSTYDLTLQKGKGKAIRAWLYKDSIVSVKSDNNKIISHLSHDDKYVYVEASKTLGEGTVTVTTKSGIKKKMKVTVQKDKVVTKELTVEPTTITLSASGEKYKRKYTLSVYAKPGRVSTDQPVTVSMSKASNKIVSASYNAKYKRLTLTAKKKGNATVKVKAGSKQVTLKLTVKK